MTTCERCDAPASDEYAMYCDDCRGELVLPCDDCGGTYGPTTTSASGGAAVKWCPDCGRVCAYWDDEDLCEREETTTT